MTRLRLISALTLLPFVVAGFSTKTPAQTPTSVQAHARSAGHPTLWVVKGPNHSS